MVTLARRLHEFEAEVGLEDLPETVWDGVTSPGRAMQPRHAGFLTNLYTFDNMAATKWLAIAGFNHVSKQCENLMCKTELETARL